MKSKFTGDRSPVYSGSMGAAEHRGAGLSEDRDTLEPIAIVGLSFGFPGDATSSEAFWDMLMSKRGTMTAIPEERFSQSAMYHPDANRKGQIAVRGAHFLKEDIAAFDAPFFTISPADSAAMDPQQRALLEYTYKALENAGLPLESVTGSKTSVYTGCFTNDWQHISFKDSEQCETSTALGIQPCVNANRISWFYNFTGNSANIDTACSSSLVALDLGCKGLLCGDTEMSIVTGSNLIFSPDTMHALTNMNMLSADGECYSFDHRANGYSRGEGFGVLVLKRLSDAIKNGDTVRALIRNTGCNQDGYTPGITQPNSLAQEALIRDTYAAAGLSMKHTRFFEAHGTGTPVGDPLESTAIGSAFRTSRTPEDPLYVGAVKSNLGHLEGASGIAGVIKAVLVLEKGIIPPNTNFEKTNPKIDTEFLRIKFPLQAIPWPTTGLRRASVNSFGFGGTNAHAVLDDAFHYLQNHGLSGHHITVEYPPAETFQSTEINLQIQNGHANHEKDYPPQLLMFSSNDEGGIRRQVASYVSHISRNNRVKKDALTYMRDLAYTLDKRRSSLPWKSFAIATSLEDLVSIDTSISSPVKALSKPTLGFVFTGQGAQWAGMGRELQIYDTFRQSLCEAEKYFTELGAPWKLREELFKENKSSNINRPDFSQPLCTAVQVALLDLLSAFGILPTAVVGHSSGEIAAAYSVGALSAKSAWKISYYRGVCAADILGKAELDGGMIAVGLSSEDVSPYLEKIAVQFGKQGLNVACINSHKNVTVAGDIEQVDALKKVLDDETIFSRKLLVDVAYHSPHMKSVALKYENLLGFLEQGAVSHYPCTMISSVTGKRVDINELTSPTYWVANMISPVRFSEVVDQICARSAGRIRKKLDLSHRKSFHINMLVEIGPHSALQGPVRDILTKLPGGGNISYCSVLVRKQYALQSLLTAIGQLKCLGYSLDLEKICYPNTGGYASCMALPDLPEYPFNHSKTYWYESRLSKRFRTHHQSKLDLLGKPVPDWNPLEAKWRNVLRVAEMPWIEDHVINGSMVYPAAGMLAMAIEAANQMADPNQTLIGFEIKDAVFQRSLTIPSDTAGVEIQLSLHLPQNNFANSNSWAEFRLCAYESDEWHECCHGTIRVEYQVESNLVDAGKEKREELEIAREKDELSLALCNNRMDPVLLYETLNNNGFGFGPAFQPISNASFSANKESHADIKLFEWPEDQHPQPHIVHPTSLDGMLHLSIAGYAQGGKIPVPTMIPTLLRSLWVSKTGLNHKESASVSVSTWMTAEDNRGTEFDATVLDTGKTTVLAHIHGLKLTIIADSTALAVESQAPQVCYHLETLPDPNFLLRGQIGTLSSMTQSSNENLETLSSYLNILGHKRPDLRVLEIASDSHNLTKRIIEGFSTQYTPAGQHTYRYTSYHCTNISQTSIDQVREDLAQYPRVTFGTLDMSTDLSSQGYELESYDIIIITSPISTSPNATTILDNVWRLLATGGKLIVSEDTMHDSFCFSLVPKSSLNAQTWVLEDALENWKQICKSTRLSPVDPLSLGSFPENIDQTESRLTTPSNLIAKVRKDASILLVSDPSSVFQSQLSEQLIKSFKVHGLLDCHTIEVSAIDSTEFPQPIYIFLVELDQPFLYKLSEDVYPTLKRFLITASDIMWINAQGGDTIQKPEYTLSTGLARALRNEYSDHRFTTLALELQDSISELQLQMIYDILVLNHLRDNAVDCEPEYIEIDGKLSIQRLVQSPQLGNEIYKRSLSQQSELTAVANAPPLSLTIESPGLLDTLCFVEDPIFSEPLGDDEVEIQTRAVGMNFKDCLIALGQIPGTTFGLECSGVVTRAGRQSDLVPGDRIVMAAPGSFRTFTRGKAAATCKIPDSMSFIEAASIPAQFGTAWEVLHEMARIRQGETVLIHAAAGGTGQAAIQITQYLGGTVFATVGSHDKKLLLMEEYSIPEDHIFYSRDTSFAKGIKRMTGGKGVDVIINSLAGESLKASWECIASYGRFVEIGKKDIVSNAGLPMLSFGKNASFIGFDASIWQKERPLEANRDLKILVGLFEKEIFHTARPLHVHDISNTEGVFRLMQDGKLSGKIVLHVTPDSQIPTILSTKPSFLMKPNATYVIAGGLGGLGRSIARWMVDRNAKNLVLLSRSGPRLDVAKSFLKELRDRGVRIEAPPCDVSDAKRMAEVFEDLSKSMPPVKGCIQGSMVRRDELFENMGYDSWKTAVECKTIGSWNLHKILPTGMDFFILLSSAAGLVGLRGQTNYAAGNVYEDSLARYRVSHGEKAVALDLGAMIDDGLLAENPELLSRVLAYGTLNPVSREQFFAILDYYCDPRLPVLTPRESQAVIGLGAGGGPGLDGVNLDKQPLFRHLIQVNQSQNVVQGEDKEDMVNFKYLLSESDSLLEGGNVVVRALIWKLAKSLSTMQDKDIDIHKPLHSYGVDSLLAVELRNWIAKEFLADVAVFETLGASTFSTLGMLVAGRSGIKHPAWAI